MMLLKIKRKAGLRCDKHLCMWKFRQLFSRARLYFEVASCDGHSFWDIYVSGKANVRCIAYRVLRIA
jgi:hypothetical protein